MDVKTFIVARSQKYSGYIVDVIDSHSKEGWEYYDSIDFDGGGMILIFKRPKSGMGR